MSAETSTTVIIARWRTLIVATGAVQWIEQMIDRRRRRMRYDSLDSAGIDRTSRAALADMAAACTERAA